MESSPASPALEQPLCNFPLSQWADGGEFTSQSVRELIPSHPSKPDHCYSPTHSKPGIANTNTIKSKGVGATGSSSVQQSTKSHKWEEEEAKNNNQ